MIYSNTLNMLNKQFACRLVDFPPLVVVVVGSPYDQIRNLEPFNY